MPIFQELSQKLNCFIFTVRQWGDALIPPKRKLKHKAVKSVPKAPSAERRAAAPGFSPGCQVVHMPAILPQIPSCLNQIRSRKPLRVGNHWQLFLNSYLSLMKRQMNSIRSHWALEIHFGTVLHLQIFHLRSRCSDCSKVPHMKLYILLLRLPVTYMSNAMDLPYGHRINTEKCGLVTRFKS